VGVGRLGAGVRQRHRDRVDGEVAQRQIRTEVRAAKPGDVDVPGAIARQRAPGPELRRELERRATAGIGDCPRGGALVGAHGDVDVDHVATEDGVADRPAHDPGIVALGERLAGRANGRSLGQGVHERHRTYSRGTRDEIPQVTS
jgi:hypothetical protein